ncbi:DMT family transporter [Chitinimonas sp. JJ19]|uniref:DMT family transporter n=1 Tax=Chitinimonas sp. JJ19 TaxID=3109352 RepID=UPI001A3CC215|nr:EamA family transporter [Chitinimonas sp.]
MPTSLAYLGVVTVWSTTALAINWSVAGMSFTAALAGRMALGALAAGLLMLVWRQPLPLDGASRRTYLIAGVAMASSMACTYFGARYISSGLMAVLFGLSPLITALFASLIIGERPGRGQVLGMLLGLAGLWCIFRDRVSLGPEAHWGIAGGLMGNVLQALGAVLTKRHGADTPPLATATGALTVSALLTLAGWWLLDGQWPAAAGLKQWGAVVYLALVGSVLAMSLYFLLIQRLPTAHVALITLITPVTALWLGHVANDEAVSAGLLTGTALIVVGLLVHQLPLWKLWAERMVREAE